MEVQTTGRSIDSVLERVLSMNILSSDYFKEIHQLKTYHEVVDEIYNQVDHVEPWMTGNCRGPSTAFCLLYKLFTLKLTVKQMHGLLKHRDSPYIRAVGFLYLRCVADPKTLWGWCEHYVKDDEEFSPGSNGRVTTMGVYVRDLLLGQYYFDTLFPRIPLPIVRQIVKNLEKMNLPAKHSGLTGEADRRGGSDDIARRPPSVKASLSVSFGQRAPHRASTRDSSPVRRTIIPSNEKRHREDEPRRPSPAHGHQDRSREIDRRRHGYDDRRDRETRRSSYSDRDYNRHRGPKSRHSRSRSRSPSLHGDGTNHRLSSPFKEASTSRNLAKLKDLYGETSDTQSYGSGENKLSRDTNTDEVIRLGGSSWK